MHALCCIVVVPSAAAAVNATEQLASVCPLLSPLFHVSKQRQNGSLCTYIRERKK